MASATAVAARTTAETAYSLAYHVAERKKNPAGQGNVNTRQLKAALAEVQAKWAELKVAQLNYQNKFVFPDDDARTTDLNTWLEKHDHHDDWVESVEMMLGQMEVANAPPVPVVLSPEQLQDRFLTQVANREASLTEMADRLTTSLDDNTNTFSKPLLDLYGRECDTMLAELSGNLATLHLSREERDPVNWEEHSQSATEFSRGITIKVLLIKEKIAARAATGHVIDGGHGNCSGSGAAYQTTYKEYKREDFPTYDGTIREYPRFKKEWQSLVAPGRPQDWQLIHLDKRTPKDTDLAICVTLEEAWQLLDDRYACPTTVSTKLVQVYMDTKLKARGDASKLVEINRNLVTLYNDLVAVKQEDQVTNNAYLLIATIKWIPEKYQGELNRVRRLHEETPGMTLWKVLSKFLKDTVKDEQRYTPWNLDEENLKESPSKKQCFTCKHEARDSPDQNAVQKINVLNIKDVATFNKFKSDTGACPMCEAEVHTWRKNGFDMVSNQLKDCPTFCNLASGHERAVRISAVKGCAMCTSFKHETGQCNRNMRACWVDAGGKECGQMHHKLLHGNSVVGCNTVSIAKLSHQEADGSNEMVMLHMVQYTFPREISTIIFFDDGATCSIITHKLAGILGLKGRKVTQNIETAGRNFEPLETMEYNVTIKDNEGIEYKLALMGLDRITTNPGKIDISEAYQLFPHITARALDRPSGEVGMLIGQNHVALLPTGGEGVDCRGNLRVMKTKFGSGVVLGGSHPSLTAEGVHYTEKARKVCYARRVGGKQMNFLRKKTHPAFLEVEESINLNENRTISMKAATGYVTSNFLTQSELRCAERGNPSFEYTDMGKDLVKAASYDKEEVDGENIIAKTVKDGTRWKIAPPGLVAIKLGAGLGLILTLLLIMKCSNEEPCRVTIFGDSECNISVMESVTYSLALHFSNRINKAEEMINSLGKIMEMNVKEETGLENYNCPSSSVLVGRLYHTPFVRNVPKEETRMRTKYYEKFNVIKSVAKLDRFSFSEEAEKELDGVGGVRVDVTEATTEDLGRESNIFSNTSLDENDQGGGGRVDVAKAATENIWHESDAISKANLDDNDEGGRADFAQAVIKDLGGESDVISNLLSTIPSYDSNRLSTVLHYDSDLQSIIPSYDSKLLFTVPSYDPSILSTVPSLDSAATNWSDIDKDKGDNVTINVDNVTGDEVDEEEKDLQKGLNKLRMRNVN